MRVAVERVDADTARFLDAQDEAVGIPKDSRDSWRAGRDGVARVSPTAASTARKAHIVEVKA